MKNKCFSIFTDYYENVETHYSLIVGIKPRDSFDRLFPYENAMIEVTEADFADKIDYFINNPEEYDRIVEKNYEYVMANHRWKNRYDIMILQLSTQ